MAKRSDTANLLPAYLVVGEDELKRSAVLGRLRSRVAAIGDISFNSDSFSGDAASGADIVSACNTIPFASEIRLVVVQAADKLKKADAEAVAAYLGSPCETTVLALFADKLAKSTRLYKAAAALGSQAVIDCAPQKRRDLARTVRALGKEQGVALTDRAAEKLIDLVGENTVRLDAEVKKIALSHLGSDSIDESDVGRLVARTSEAKPWQFVDAFAARNAAGCAAFLARPVSTSPYALIAMCTTRLRELVCAKALDERGAGGMLASELKMPGWRVKNHIAWSRAFTARELRRAISTSRDAERAMKSGADPDETLLVWVLSVVAPQQAER